MRTAAVHATRAASTRGGRARAPRLSRPALRLHAEHVRAAAPALRPEAPFLLIEPVSAGRLFVAWSAAPAGRRARPLVLRLWCWPRSDEPFHADIPLPADDGSRTVEVRLEASYAGQLGRLRTSGALHVEAATPKASTPPSGPSDDLSLVVCDVREALPATSRPWRERADFPPTAFPRFGKPDAGRMARPTVPPVARVARVAAGIFAEADSEPEPNGDASGSGADGGSDGGWPWPAGAEGEAAG